MARLFNSILITGGAGYCGSYLVPQLLREGYKITVYDALYFGDQFLPKDHPNLKVIHGDIRNIKLFSDSIEGIEAVLHLACISNDASFELDEELSTTINMHAFEPLVSACKNAGVKRFIYASSSSVYGVSDAPDVTEDHPLVPLTLYNKFKGLCEPILNNYASDSFIVSTFRPATVCGYAPRLRLDLSVNILTNHAVTKNKITVFGGSQLRPNLNVKDYANICQLLLESPSKKIHKDVFNIGNQNMSIEKLADLVKNVVSNEFPEKQNIEIVKTESNDNRSYHINSDKVANVLGFVPKYSIEDAIKDLCIAFKNGHIPNSFENDIYYNIRTMKKIHNTDAK